MDWKLDQKVDVHMKDKRYIHIGRLKMLGNNHLMLSSVIDDKTIKVLKLDDIDYIEIKS